MANKMRIIDLIMKVPTISLKPVLSKILQIRRRTLAVILAAAAIPLILLTYGFVEVVGTQKLYCLNCHINQRNMDFWKKSSVHPQLSCATCHDAEKSGAIGAAFHFGFSAKEDVLTGHCMGCHKKDLDIMVGADAKVKKRQPYELIRIPHTKHIKELGIKCTYCHSNVFHERRPAKFATYRPTMETCYTCHDEKTTPCVSCHPNGMPSGVSMSGNVGGGNITYIQRGAGDAVFSHKRHAATGLVCGSCHPTLFKMERTHGVMTMAGMESGKFCGHCHNGKGAFKTSDCGRCHRGGASGGGMIAFEGGGFGQVLFSHEKHLAKGLECKNCHATLFGYGRSATKVTMDGMRAGRSCGGCHNGSKAFSSEQCDRCHKGGKKDGGIIAYEGGGGGKVMFSHEMHIAMGLDCKGCHTALFGYRKNSTNNSMDSINGGKSCGGCHDGKKAFAADKCDGCHQAG